MIIMMKGNTEYNFIKRTRSLVQQYDCLGLSEADMYDVTLLLNACLGLLVIIEERYKTYRPKKFKSLDSLKSATTLCLSKNFNPKSKNCKNIFGHLRDSIAHCHFYISEIVGDKITKICFKNYLNDAEIETEKLFEAVIEVGVLKKALFEYSKLTIDNYNKQHPKDVDMTDSGE